MSPPARTSHLTATSLLPSSGKAAMGWWIELISGAACDVVAGLAQVPPCQPCARPTAAAGVALISWTVTDRVAVSAALLGHGVALCPRQSHRPEVGLQGMKPHAGGLGGWAPLGLAFWKKHLGPQSTRAAPKWQSGLFEGLEAAFNPLCSSK